jgi:hypothetical protein
MTDETFDLNQLDIFAQTEGLRIEDICDDFSRLRFIDVESSGLDKESYPIEYGSCGLDLKSASFLIKRKTEFTLQNWSGTAQALHKIAPEDLELSGIMPCEAVARVKLDLAPGMVGLSDNAEHDGQWLAKLSPDLEGLDIYPLNLFLRIATNEALNRHGYERLSLATRLVQKNYPHLHRAGPDSLRMAALFRLLVDDEFVIQVVNE